MKSVEGSLFRLIFLKKCLGTYSFQTHRCTKVIKHSACAMKMINPFWANPQSCNSTYSYGKWMKITYLNGDFPWQTVELPEVLPEKLRLAPEIIALPKPKVQCSDPKVKGHRDHLKKKHRCLGRTLLSIKHPSLDTHTCIYYIWSSVPTPSPPRPWSWVSHSTVPLPPLWCGGGVVLSPPPLWCGGGLVLYGWLVWYVSLLGMVCLIWQYVRSVWYVWLLPVVPHKAVAEVSKIGNL